MSDESNLRERHLAAILRLAKCLSRYLMHRSDYGDDTLSQLREELAEAISDYELTF